MPANDRDSPLDGRIDAALRSYAEPPDSVSDAHIATAAILDRGRAPRRPLWVWAIPAAACVLALAFGLALRTRHATPAPQVARIAAAPAAMSSRPVAGTAKTPAAQSPAAGRRVAKAGAAPAAARRAGPRTHPRSQPLPELAVFPTPVPLSAQERQLVDFARNAPAAVKQAVIRDQQHWGQPIGDAALRLQPPGIPAAQLAAPDKENP